VKKILFIAPNWLGDAVMSLPLAGMLSAAGGARVTVLAPDYTARVYMGHRELPEIAVVARRRRLHRIAASARTIRVLQADGAVVLPPSFSSALAVFLGGVPVRVGYAGDGRRGLLTSPLPADGKRDEHLSNNYLRLGTTLLDALRLDTPQDYRRPAVHVYPSEERKADAILRERGAPRSGFAVVVPGATFGPAKSWPRRHYRRFLELLSPRLPVVLGGTGAERSLCDRLAEGLENVFNLAGGTSLGEFIALLARAEIVVANDSGAAHVAASLGAPVLALFGSTSPRWTAPQGPYVEIIHGDVSCAPCYLEDCPRELECFAGIEPERVLERAEHLLKKKSR
jgi:heptosyltransferase-2